MSAVCGSCSLGVLKPPVARLACCHYFCMSCISESLRSQSKCPLCKTSCRRRDISRDEKMDRVARMYMKLERASGEQLICTQLSPPPPMRRASPVQQQHMSPASPIGSHLRTSGRQSSARDPQPSGVPVSGTAHGLHTACQPDVLGSPVNHKEADSEDPPLRDIVESLGAHQGSGPGSSGSMDPVVPDSYAGSLNQDASSDQDPHPCDRKTVQLASPAGASHVVGKLSPPRLSSGYMPFSWLADAEEDAYATQQEAVALTPLGSTPGTGHRRSIRKPHELYTSVRDTVRACEHAPGRLASGGDAQHADGDQPSSDAASCGTCPAAMEQSPARVSPLPQTIADTQIEISPAGLSSQVHPQAITGEITMRRCPTLSGVNNQLCSAALHGDLSMVGASALGHGSGSKFGSAAGLSARMDSSSSLQGLEQSRAAEGAVAIAAGHRASQQHPGGSVILAAGDIVQPSPHQAINPMGLDPSREHLSVLCADKASVAGSAAALQSSEAAQLSGLGCGACPANAPVEGGNPDKLGNNGTTQSLTGHKAAQAHLNIGDPGEHGHGSPAQPPPRHEMNGTVDGRSGSTPRAPIRQDKPSSAKGSSGKRQRPGSAGAKPRPSKTPAGPSRLRQTSLLPGSGPRSAPPTVCTQKTLLLYPGV
ncbi:hypothetical protein WJX84_004666 [Apatococcus fuscideae]|uniref:RING-type domain-containing protein n=1 Tax=Apatococcus fuscideae TaxID=2026836 RepID=A0AAW1TB84_9CHLO